MVISLSTKAGILDFKKNIRKRTEERMQKYVCQVCGYIYDPEEGDTEGDIPAGTPFEKLPDDWSCPVCGASKSEFAPE